MNGSKTQYHSVHYTILSMIYRLGTGGRRHKSGNHLLVDATTKAKAQIEKGRQHRSGHPHMLKAKVCMVADRH